MKIRMDWYELPCNLRRKFKISIYMKLEGYAHTGL